MSFCKFERVEGRKAVYCAACGKYCAVEKLRECVKPDPLIVRYGMAVAQWIKAGRPERSDAEVDQLLADHCSQCELFQNGHCSHASCGCAVKSTADETAAFIGRLVSLVSPAFSNKLRMATEHCPLDKG